MTPKLKIANSWSRKTGPTIAGSISCRLLQALRLLTFTLQSNESGLFCPTNLPENLSTFVPSKDNVLSDINAEWTVRLVENDVCYPTASSFFPR